MNSSETFVCLVFCWWRFFIVIMFCLKPNVYWHFGYSESWISAHSFVLSAEGSAECLISLAADLKFLSCPNICHYWDREERESREDKGPCLSVWLLCLCVYQCSNAWRRCWCILTREPQYLDPAEGLIRHKEEVVAGRGGWVVALRVCEWGRALFFAALCDISGERLRWAAWIAALLVPACCPPPAVTADGGGGGGRPHRCKYLLFCLSGKRCWDGAPPACAGILMRARRRSSGWRSLREQASAPRERLHLYQLLLLLLLSVCLSVSQPSTSLAPLYNPNKLCSEYNIIGSVAQKFFQGFKRL